MTSLRLRPSILLVVVCLAACAGPRIATDYEGPHAGTVIVGLGTTDGKFQNHDIDFRLRAEATTDGSKPPGHFGG